MDTANVANMDILNVAQHLLEQERIPWAHAYQQLTHTIGTPASPG